MQSIDEILRQLAKDREQFSFGMLLDKLVAAYVGHCPDDDDYEALRSELWDYVKERLRDE